MYKISAKENIAVNGDKTSASSQSGRPQADILRSVLAELGLGMWFRKSICLIH